MRNIWIQSIFVIFDQNRKFSLQDEMIDKKKQKKNNIASESEEEEGKLLYSCV